MALLSQTEIMSIKELPRDELMARLQGLQAEQLRFLCGSVGTQVKGTKPDMQTRILDKILKGREVSTEGLEKSPEGRDGRHRSPKTGPAATAVRAAVASSEVAAGQAVTANDRVRTRSTAAAEKNSGLTESPTVAEFLDETPAALTVLPKVEPLPGFVQGANLAVKQPDELPSDSFADSPALWSAPATGSACSYELHAFQGFNDKGTDYEIFTLISEYVHDYLPGQPVEVLGTSMGHVGIRLPTAQREAVFKAMTLKENMFKFKGHQLSLVSVDAVHAARFVVPEEPPAQMAIDEEFSDVSDASEVSGEVSMNDLMRKLNSMEKQQKKDRTQLQKKVREQTRVMIAAAVDPVKDALADVKSNVEAQDTEINKLKVEFGKFRVSQDDRVSQDEHGSGGSKRRGSLDDSFKKLAVLGFEAKVSLQDRLAAMKRFMESKFPNVEARYSVIHTGSWKEKGKNRKMSSVGLIDVGCPDLREHLIKSIESKSLKMPCSGKDLKIVRAKTKSASDRDGALKKACDLLKKQAGVQDHDVSIEWVGSRGVKLKGVFVYTQPNGNEKGSFVGNYAHLTLP